MTSDERDAVLAQTERWLVQHGLPYFVVSEHEDVDEALARRRLVMVVATGVLLAAVGAAAVGWWVGDASSAVLAALVVLGAVAAGYALVELSIWPILRWAMRHTFGSLRLLFPLVTRALPLLLLFVTFLFINAEVWQVASSMDRPLLWVTVLLFAALAVVFLLARLPEELERVGQEAHDERLVELCRDTPVQRAAEQLPASAPSAAVTGLPRANLTLVLLVAQAVQVLLLAVAVFAFFAVFGRLSIGAEVVQSWTGDPEAPHYLGDIRLISAELFQVSVFLAAFSGLYFTVYAVTDETYRREFFTAVTRELERAVGVLTVYRALRAEAAGDAAPAGDWEEPPARW